MMFERGPVYFLSDVFAIVADVGARANLNDKAEFGELRSLLTLHINVLCLWCITTLIAGFTSVVSSFTPVNIGEL